MIKIEIDNIESSVALDNKVSADIADSYTGSNNKNLNEVELQLTNLRASIQNLEEHQNIITKQIQ